MNDKKSCVYTQVTSKMSCFNWIPAFAGMTASKRGLMQKLLSGEWHIKTVISGKPWTTEKNCHSCESRDPPEKVEDFRSRGLDYIDRSKHQWIASLFMNKRQGFKSV